MSLKQYHFVLFIYPNTLLSFFNSTLISTLSGVIIAFIVWVIELFVVIGFLVSSRVRFVGYGLLTAFLITPIVTAVACNALPNIIHA